MQETKSILKAMAVLESIARGSRTLTEIHEDLDVPVSTVHRTLKSLMSGRYVRDVKGIGYVLGTGMIRLGNNAQDQMPLKAIARPYLEKLARDTKDTIHLGIREEDYVFYLDKVPGSRRIEMKSLVGDRLPLAGTGIGKSLILDMPGREIERIINSQVSNDKKASMKKRMEWYRSGDYSFDLEDSSELLRCVAVPIRNRHDNIIAAISLASINIYLDEQRMFDLIPVLQHTAQLISKDIERV